MKTITVPLLVIVVVATAGCSKATKGGPVTQGKASANLSSAPLAKPDSRTARQDSTSAGFVQVPVTVLPTSDAMKGKGMYSEKYPSSDYLNQLDGFANQIQEYGGAYKLWLGPRGWSGSSALGADGNVSVALYPLGGSDSSGPHMNYVLIPACEGCILSNAAPFFHQAMESWNQQYNQDGSLPIEVPSGLKVDSLSPTLVSYSLPDSAGLLTYGIVYYDSMESSDVPFAEAKFVCPQADSALAKFLSNSFVTREGLK